MTTAAIVLAGGASTRFGADKLAASLDGRPLLHHALAAVGEVAGVIVVVLAPEAPVPPLPADLAARIAVARDPAAHRGPLAGLAAGLAAVADARRADGEAADGDAVPDLAVVVAGDMPSLVPAVLRLLVARLAEDPSVAAVTLEADPPSPMPLALRVAASRAAADTLLAADRRALRGLLAAVPSAVVPAAGWRALDPAGATLRDVDRPGDLSL